MTYTPEQQQLAQTVLDHIEANPEKHIQKLWAGDNKSCGTVGCIAGWTVMLGANATVVKEPDYISPNFAGYRSLYLQLPDGAEFFDPSHMAAEMLGLSDADSLALFMLGSEETAREALRYIANGKGIDWDKISQEYDTRTVTEMEEDEQN